jgi:hypothetical protein
MSSRKNQDIQKNPQKYDYMKKKQNKGKKFSRDKKNFELSEENYFNNNDLPEGAFNKDDKLFQKIIEPTNTIKNNSIEYSEPKLNNIEEEEEYEDFDPSYFEPVQIK